MYSLTRIEMRVYCLTSPVGSESGQRSMPSPGPAYFLTFIGIPVKVNYMTRIETPVYCLTSHEGVRVRSEGPMESRASVLFDLYRNVLYDPNRSASELFDPSCGVRVRSEVPIKSRTSVLFDLYRNTFV